MKSYELLPVPPCSLSFLTKVKTAPKAVLRRSLSAKPRTALDNAIERHEDSHAARSQMTAAISTAGNRRRIAPFGPSERVSKLIKS